MTRRHAPVLAATACAVAVGLVVGFAPAASAAASGPDSELVVTGTVERFLVDDFASHEAGEDDASLTFVNTGDAAVQVPASALAQVADGATVRVSLADSATAEVSASGVEPFVTDGTDTEAGAAVTGLAVVAQPAAGLTDTGTGAAPAAVTVQATSSASHHVLVVVATPSNGTASSVSAADVAATVRGSVSSYWSRMTGGSVTFDATAYPSVVKTASTPCAASGDASTSFEFWNEIKATTGWSEGPGKHLVVYFRTLTSCGGIAGLGTVGSDRASGGMLWSNGYNTTGVLGHELGHNLSLGHSSTLACTSGGTRVTDAAGAACVKKSYLDTNDIMGVSWQNQGFLNGSHLRYLGLLTSSSAQARPTRSGRAVLAPLESGAGLRLLTLADGTTSYVLEFRAATGQDAWMAGAPGWGSTGVTVRRETAGSTSFPLRESLLLDGDPSTADASLGALDAALPRNSWVELADGRLRVRLVSTSSSAAVVDYEIGGVPAVTQLAVAVLGMTDPVASLRTGTMTRTSSGPVVPVTWSWGVTTEAGTTTARTLTTGLASSAWNMLRRTTTVTDGEGTIWTATGATKANYRSDRVATTYVGPWTLSTTSSANGGSLHRTSTKYASATTTVTASSIAVLLQRGSHHGTVAVLVDGVKVATVDMSATASSVRVAVVKSFGSTSTHTVKVVNMTGGATGALGFDGVAILA
ncbi:zinc-dependent metalloprotease family protein [Longivirga aurantiaca]|uniref:Zinc-dependent metalloprotease family protein n=1 Tax=Longivirga aurantiaca TaxID=1837743 RepID=A0ABW1T526_9ACTN